MGAWVAPIVEFNTAAPNDTANWEDISTYVRTISTNIGRSSELDDFSNGTATVVLDNRDRRFDPLYTSGPYYGDLLPMRQIRIWVNSPKDGAGTYTYIFSGYILGWPQSYDYVSNDATVELQCVDAMYVLSTTKVADSFWATYVRNVLKPVHWYRLYETTGTVVIDECGSASNGQYTTLGVTLGNEVSNDRPTGATCATFDDGWAKLPNDVVDPAGPWSIELHVNIDGTAKNPAQAIFSLGRALIWDYVDASSKLFVYGAGTDSVIDATSFTTSAWHNVLVTFDGQTLSLYVDNVLKDSDTASAAYDMGETYPVFIGNSVNKDAADWRLGGSVHNVVIYDYVLTEAERTTLSDLFFLGSITRQVGTPIGYLLDMANFDSFNRAIDDGVDSLTPPSEANRPVLDVIKQLAASDGGVFFIAPNGYATFYDRHAPITTAVQNSVWATFDDDDSSALAYIEARPSLDDQYIYNEISVSRSASDQVTQVSADFTSQGKYGTRNKSLSNLLLTSDQQAKGFADWLLYEYKNPVARLPQLKVDARFSDTVMDKVLKIGMRYRVRVKRKPQDIGTAWQIDNLVEGIAHDIDLQERTWTTTYSLSPVDTTQYLVVGDSTLGKVGTGRAGF